MARYYSRNPKEFLGLPLGELTLRVKGTLDLIEVLERERDDDGG